MDGSVVEPSAVFSLNTTTLQCDWDPDLAVYPARLSVGVSWRADGRCSMEFGQSFQVNRSSQVTGTRSFAVSGTAVDTWVVEETLVSRSPEMVSRFVGRRTVYDFETIKTFCAHGDVLAILFRQAESLGDWIIYEQLVEHAVLTAPPQTIVQVSQRRGSEWLTQRIER